MSLQLDAPILVCKGTQGGAGGWGRKVKGEVWLQDPPGSWLYVGFLWLQVEPGVFCSILTAELWRNQSWVCIKWIYAVVRGF